MSGTWGKRVVLAVVGLGLVLGGGLGVQRATASTFDALEADQVAHDAERLRIALDAELRLLASYGATNSIWDDSRTAILQSDRVAFEEAFPPADLRPVFSIDVLLGVGTDGRPVVGGAAGDSFTAPPSELRDPAVLSRMFDPAAKAGTPTCGALTTSDGPYLYCGFGSFRSDGSGPAGGGLLVLRSLDTGRLAEISRSIDLGLSLTDTPPAGSERAVELTSRLGRMTVRTAVLGPDRIAVSAELPVLTGAVPVAVFERDRPIQRTGSTVVLAVLAGIGLLLAAAATALVIGVRRSVARRVGPLRRTAEAVVRSGDRTLRVGGDGRGEVGALARALDTMLDTLARQDADLAEQQRRREEEAAGRAVRQRLRDEHARRTTDRLLRESSRAVAADLGSVVESVQAVDAAARGIAERATEVAAARGTVAVSAEAADRHVAGLSDSIERIGGIAALITSVSEQTKLLALNASIEAARAGAAGRGFEVVAAEVKGLAGSTAESSQQIAGTLLAVEGEAAAMTQALAGMSGALGSIDEAAQGVSAEAARQEDTAQHLRDSVNGAIARLQTLTGTRGDGGFAVRLVSTGGAGTSDDDGDGDLEVLDIEGDGIVVAPSTVLGRQKQLTVELRWRARVAHASVAVGGTVRVDDRDGVRLDLVGSDPDGGTHAPTTAPTLLRDLRTELAATRG